MEDFDTGAQNFEGNKICMQNISMDNYNELEGNDRCPNLAEKSLDQFLFRAVIYLVIFTINVILVNILIGQISITLNRVMIEGDKDYYLNALELKVGILGQNTGTKCMHCMTDDDDKKVPILSTDSKKSS